MSATAPVRVHKPVEFLDVETHSLVILIPCWREGEDTPWAYDLICPKCGTLRLIEAHRVEPWAKKGVDISGNVLCKSEGCSWGVKVFRGAGYPVDAGMAGLPSRLQVEESLGEDALPAGAGQ